jgi:hypothetical protein
MSKKFIFRNNQTIGAAHAESDKHFLGSCFIDTGDIDILTNCKDHRCIIAGRTGSGKSAIITKIEEREENMIRIRPEALALTYISNSGVINFLIDVGVKLDLFYKLLWKHIFVVEVLKRRFHITEETNNGFLYRLWQLVPKNKHHEQAINYLKTWGESFWKETEYRVKEVTSKFESDVTASVGVTIPQSISLNASGARKLTEEQREEVVHRAQEVVNRVQIADLSRVIELLGEVLLKDTGKKFFIIIDKLDEDWVEDRIRFRLLRALIETTNDFDNIANLKIIFAMRNDLLDRVYRYTRSAGFQEEKYRTRTLQIKWNRPELIKLLDSRISLLIREQYTTQVVTHKDVLPDYIGNRKTIEYMLDRTLMRPRDIIMYFNECIKQSSGQAMISPKAIKEAEGVYSRERIRALADEWFGLYPNLLHLSNLLKQKQRVFLITELTDKELENNYLELLISGRGEPGLDLDQMKMVFDCSISISDYKVNLVLIFYKVGLVGIKTDPFSRFSWSDTGTINISSAEITDTAKIAVHPAFWRCLGIDYIDDDGSSDV